VFRIDGTVTTGVSLLLGEASTGQCCKSNAKIVQVKQCMLQSTVPTTLEVPCCPVGRAMFCLLLVENVLAECLPSEIMLLLRQMRGNVSQSGMRREGLDTELLELACC